MRTYLLPPLDNAWGLLPTVADTYAQLTRANPWDADPNAFLRRFREAQQLAPDEPYRTGEGPRVIWLPGPDEWELGFAWKLDNNGTTVIVSPRPLPWLAEYEVN